MFLPSQSVVLDTLPFYSPCDHFNRTSHLEGSPHQWVALDTVIFQSLRSFNRTSHQQGSSTPVGRPGYCHYTVLPIISLEGSSTSVGRLGHFHSTVLPIILTVLLALRALPNQWVALDTAILQSLRSF